MCKLKISEKLARGIEYLGEYKSEQGFFNAVKEIEGNTQRIDFNLGKAEFVGIDSPVEDEKMADIYDAGGFAVKLDGHTYKLSAKAESDMALRLGITGPTLSVLPKDSLAKILSICKSQFTKEDDKAMMVQIGDKVYAVLSDGYKVILADEVYRSAAKPIHRMGGEFVSGYLTVDNFFAEYKLNNPEIVNSYKQKCGTDFNALPVVTVETSNTGLSSVSITPKFLINGNRVITVGKSIDAAHKGETTIEKVKENCEQIFAIFQEAISGLAKLKTVRIQHPMMCFKNIAKRCQMPKGYSMMAAADFEGELLEGEEVTAFDIYVGLTEAIFHASNDGRSKVYVNNLTEICARALTLDFTRYDLPYAEWDK